MFLYFELILSHQEMLIHQQVIQCKQIDNPIDKINGGCLFVVSYTMLVPV